MSSRLKHLPPLPLNRRLYDGAIDICERVGSFAVHAVGWFLFHLIFPALVAAVVMAVVLIFADSPDGRFTSLEGLKDVLMGYGRLFLVFSVPYLLFRLFVPSPNF